MCNSNNLTFLHSYDFTQPSRFFVCILLYPLSSIFRVCSDILPSASSSLLSFCNYQATPPFELSSSFSHFSTSTCLLTLLHSPIPHTPFLFSIPLTPSLPSSQHLVTIPPIQPAVTFSPGLSLSKAQCFLSRGLHFLP